MDDSKPRGKRRGRRPGQSASVSRNRRGKSPGGRPAGSRPQGGKQQADRRSGPGKGRSVPKGQLPPDLVYGVNPVSVALDVGRLKVLYYDKGRQSERLQHLHAMANQSGVDIQPLQRQGWSRILTMEQHQGVAGRLLDTPASYLEDIVHETSKESCILVLDQVQDPQNLGAVLRSAAATGVDAVVLPKAGGCGLTPAVHKASAGQSLRVRVVENENLARALELLKDHDYWVVGCDSDPGADGQEPQNATTFQFPRKRVIVMGSEGEGMRRLVKEGCDYIIRIPMVEGVESLNISVASAVVLYLAMGDLARVDWESKDDNTEEEPA